MQSLTLIYWNLNSRNLVFVVKFLISKWHHPVNDRKIVTTVDLNRCLNELGVEEGHDVMVHHHVVPWFCFEWC